VPPASLSATQNISCAALQASRLDKKQTHIRTATAIDWASQARSVAQRHTRYQTICHFAQYLRVEDPRHESPPPNHFGYRKTRRVPHIYSRGEIDGLVLAATKLPSSDSLRPKTYAALISLLAATGLRISEALHLLVSDITPDGLLIRRTKFQKTRLVPLHDTAVAGLGPLLDAPPGSAIAVATMSLFRRKGNRWFYWKVHSVFRTLLKSAGLKPCGGRWPRIHELRHTFAVRALESSPTGRQRIGQHMLALATYLGHVNINATYWYLETTPELLREIASLPKAFCKEGGMTSLAPHMEAFLREHLARHRGASQHTCDSYAYSFQSLFEFASQKLKVAPSALMLEQLDAALISGFLEHLETTRGNSAETRNVRLAAFRSFFRFLQHREPGAIEQVRRVLAIPFKKTDTRLVGYLVQEEMQALLDAPDPSRRDGSPRSSNAASCGVRWASSLRTDRLAPRRRRAPVGEYPRAWQGPPRTRVASLEDNGCGTSCLVGDSRTGQFT
jgi:integrase/recombinase XerD